MLKDTAIISQLIYEFYNLMHFKIYPTECMDGNWRNRYFYSALCGINSNLYILELCPYFG